MMARAINVLVSTLARHEIIQ